MHVLMSLPYLHVWACHWKCSVTSNILSSLPQSFTIYQRLVTSNSCWRCTGSNPVLCREDQSGNTYSPVCFDIGKEEQSQTFSLSYQVWLRCVVGWNIVDGQSVKRFSWIAYLKKHKSGTFPFCSGFSCGEWGKWASGTVSRSRPGPPPAPVQQHRPPGRCGGNIPAPQAAKTSHELPHS